MLDVSSRKKKKMKFRLSLVIGVAITFLLTVMLVYAIMTPGVNFINIQRTAFTLVDPKSVKKIDNLTVFFTLLGSASVKAVHRCVNFPTFYAKLLLPQIPKA